MQFTTPATSVSRKMASPTFRATTVHWTRMEMYRADVLLLPTEPLTVLNKTSGVFPDRNRLNGTLHRLNKPRGVFPNQNRLRGQYLQGNPDSRLRGQTLQPTRAEGRANQSFQEKAAEEPKDQNQIKARGGNNKA